ncbi:AraC family transcriptional regulator [Asaia sp. As-1742]|uniref:AraC family transcriptional regulator n=1 Tax=Asaia sp. As-1742 TaxID=2608325 RepID=UPI0019627F0A|nr:AraC family transcriptional regulator [Asaia sp. As-1742]
MLDGRYSCRDRLRLMDPLSDILTLMRPGGYGFRGLAAGGDWALSFPAAEGLRCFAIEAGSCWFRFARDEAPVRLQEGDLVLMAARREVFLFSSAAVHPVDAIALLTSVPPGALATLNGGEACRGIGGFFGFEGVALDSLLDAVPPLLHIHADASKAVLRDGIRRLMRELGTPRPGGALLASHLAQALLVEALRAHLEEGAARQGWLAALAVPAMSRALGAMHADVARRWTLRELAGVAGMSRASFAAYFRRVTGETPIAYLTRWRMMLAADRIRHSPLTLGEVALSVGYDSESAFGAAFKRAMGQSPRAYGRDAGSRRPKESR